MNKEKFIVVLALLIGTSKGFADRENFSAPSAELRTAIAAAATSLGYDLSTEDGRKAFMDNVKAHRDEVAKAQNFDLTTQAGRDALEKYLVSSGDYASLVPAGRGNHERPQKNDKNSQTNSSGSSAGSDSGAPADSTDQKPPCGDGNGSSSSRPSHANNSGGWNGGSASSGASANAAANVSQQRPPQRRR